MKRGAPPTLATALCLGRWDDVDRLLQAASDAQKQFALVLSALNGKADALRRIVRAGADVNAPSPELYAHGAPLHHAVSSGSLDAVRVLVEAGADLARQDLAWGGTPLGWAEHYIGEAKGDSSGKPYAEIAAYLRERPGTGVGEQR